MLRMIDRLLSKYHFYIKNIFYIHVYQSGKKNPNNREKKSKQNLEVSLDNRYVLILCNPENADVQQETHVVHCFKTSSLRITNIYSMFQVTGRLHLSCGLSSSISRHQFC